MTRKVYSFVALGLTLGASLALHGCGNGSAPTLTRGYAGAGSDWRWTLKSDGNFTATESGTSTTFTGRILHAFERIDSRGFSRRTGSAPASGTVIPGLEVPGFALLFAPVLGSETQIVGNIASGTCPTANFVDNYLYMQFSPGIDLTTTNREFFGTFAWDTSTNTGQAVTQYTMNYSTISFPSPVSGSCTNGVMNTNAFNAYLTPGAAFVKSIGGGPTSGDGLIAVPKAPLGSLSRMYGKYSGLIYDATSTPQVREIVTTINSPTFTVNSVSATDLTTLDGAISATVNLTDVDQPSAGFIKGNVSGNNLICMGAANVLSSSKNVLFCLGKNPSNTTKPYSVILVSHD